MICCFGLVRVRAPCAKTQGTTSTRPQVGTLDTCDHVLPAVVAGPPLSESRVVCLVCPLAPRRAGCSMASSRIVLPARGLCPVVRAAIRSIAAGMLYFFPPMDGGFDTGTPIVVSTLPSALVAPARTSHVSYTDLTIEVRTSRCFPPYCALRPCWPALAWLVLFWSPVLVPRLAAAGGAASSSPSSTGV